MAISIMAMGGGNVGQVERSGKGAWLLVLWLFGRGKYAMAISIGREIINMLRQMFYRKLKTDILKFLATEI
jgi:hypothetical protein